MGSWKDLPPEIQNIMFGQLKRDRDASLLQCQLACKHWHDQAQRNLYKSINLNLSNSIMKLLRALTSSDPNPGRLVLKVFIDNWSDDRIVPYEGLVQLLLSRCPNIEKFDLDDYENNNGDVFGEIRIAYEIGACKRLKRVPELKDESQDFSGEYYDTVYCLRNSLENLFLDETLVRNSKICASSLMKSLDKFPNLRSLKVQLKYKETMYRIGEYTASCTGLEKLVFNGSRIPSTHEDVRSITPCPSIKSVHFTSVFVTKKLLEYIMQAFPNLVEISMYEWHIIILLSTLISQTTSQTPSQAVCGSSSWFI